MNPAEAQVLLSMCATVDNRKPDEGAARGWAAMLDDVRFEDARVAVIEHYRTSTEWLMPAKVRTDVKRIRAKRIAAADGELLIPPDGLTEAEERRWLHGRREAIANGDVVQPARGELKPRNLGDLGRLMPKPESEES